MIKKRLHSGWICLLIMVLALSVLASGCGKASEMAAEKAAEKAIESASGGEVKVDLSNDGVKVDSKDGSSSFQSGGDITWPKSMPTDVPQLKDAKIVNVSESSTADGKSVVVWYEGLKNSDQVDQYKSSLESNGWTIAATTSTPDGTYFMAEKTGWELAATFNVKEGNGMIGVTEHKE